MMGWRQRVEGIDALAWEKHLKALFGGRTSRTDMMLQDMGSIS